MRLASVSFERKILLNRPRNLARPLLPIMQGAQIYNRQIRLGNKNNKTT